VTVTDAIQFMPASAETDRLLVTFGGIAGGFALPPFEFNRLPQDLGSHRLFIRDRAQAWYECGVHGLGGTVAQIADGLRARIADIAPQRTVFIGNSMGVFGALLDVPEVNDFAPQTFMDRRSRVLARGFRWRHQTRALHRARAMRREDAVLDLRAPLRQARQTRFHVHYGTDDRLDSLHARRLEKMDAVTLYPQHGGNHALVKDLRDTGVLLPALRKALLLD
jgi:hypothetical protein